MLPLLDNEDDDDVDAWNDPSSATAGGEVILSKYDDVEDMAMKKKRANRMEIGGKVG